MLRRQHNILCILRKLNPAHVTKIRFLKIHFKFIILSSVFQEVICEEDYKENYFIFSWSLNIFSVQ
jgi:hypothetical protein